MDKLINVVESILFLSGDAISVRDVTDKLDVGKKEVVAALEKLAEKYSGDCGIQLIKFNDKYQFCSNSAYAEKVESVLNPIRERELSKSLLEVSAIIAYKQPITRAEIDDIRGVSSDYAITALLKHNLIEAKGRKEALGKPVLYGTTDDFLKRFQLTGLGDLPDYKTVMDRIKVVKASDDLYARTEEEELPAEEIEVPDFLKD